MLRHLNAGHRLVFTEGGLIFWGDKNGVIIGGDPIIAGSLIAGGAGLIGASKQASASKKAASLANQSNQQALAFQREMFEKMLGLQSPFIGAGTKAINLLSDYATQEDPYFKRDLKNAMTMTNSILRAKGLSGSSYGLRALQDTGTAMWANERNRQLNLLGQLAGYGTNAIGNATGAGQNFANAMGTTLGNMGANLGNAQLASANAWNQGLGGFANAIGGGLNAYRNQQMWNQAPQWGSSPIQTTPYVPYMQPLWGGGME